MLRISAPAVPDDWRARMWTVLKHQLEQTAPGQFGILLKDMVREGWAFIALSVLALLLTTLFPQIVSWLPQTMGYVTR